MRPTTPLRRVRPLNGATFSLLPETFEPFDACTLFRAFDASSLFGAFANDSLFGAFEAALAPAPDAVLAPVADSLAVTDAVADDVAAGAGAAAAVLALGSALASVGRSRSSLLRPANSD